jgi:hypothetical protein
MSKYSGWWTDSDHWGVTVTFVIIDIRHCTNALCGTRPLFFHSSSCRLPASWGFVSHWQVEISLLFLTDVILHPSSFCQHCMHSEWRHLSYSFCLGRKEKRKSRGEFKNWDRLKLGFLLIPFLSPPFVFRTSRNRASPFGRYAGCSLSSFLLSWSSARQNDV